MKRVALVLFFLSAYLYNVVAFAQSSSSDFSRTITGKDSAIIIREAEKVIQISLNSLLNNLTNSAFTDQDHNSIIKGSFKTTPNAKNPIFLNENIIIENDLDPTHSAEESAQNDAMDIKKYLGNFLYSSFEYGEDKSTELFHAVATSLEIRNDTAIVNVDFETKFKKKIKDTGSTLPLMAKHATVYVVIKDKDWVAFIASVRHNITPDSKSYWGRYSSQQRHANRKKTILADDKDAAGYVDQQLRQADSIYFSYDYTYYDLASVKSIYEEVSLSDPENEYVKQRLQNIAVMMRNPDEENQNLDKWKKAATYARNTLNHAAELDAWNRLAQESKGEDVLKKIEQIKNRNSEIDRVSRAFSDGQYSQSFQLADELVKKDTADFEFYFLRARALLKTNDYTNAMKDIQKAIGLNKGALDLFQMRGEIYVQLGNFDAAMKDFATLISNDSINPHFLSAYAECCFKLKDWKNAEKYFSKALNHDAANGHFMERLADSFFEDNLMAEANQQYVAATDFVAEGNVFYRAGYTYIQLGKSEAAAANFEKALDPKYKLSDSLKTYISNWERNQFNMGLRYLNDRPNEALTCFKSCVKVNPARDSSWYYIGHILFQSGKNEGAKKNFDECLKRTPSFFLALYERGQCRIQLGDYKAALDDLGGCIFLAHSPLINKDIFSFVGDAYTLQGKLVDANAYYEKSLKENKTQPEVYYKIGRNLYDSNPKEAISNFDNAIDYKRTYADAYFWRGKSYMQLQKYPKAIADFNLTRDNQSAYPKVFFELGNCYYEKAKESLLKLEWESAISNYGEELALDPRNTDAYIRKAACETEIDLYANACKTYEQLKDRGGDSVLYKDDKIIYTYAYSEIRILENEVGKSILDRGIKLFPHSAALLYAYACYYADKKDVSKTIEYLLAILKSGGTLTKKMIKDDVMFRQIIDDAQIKDFIKKNL